MHNEQEKKRGRPRKQKEIILYRSGRRIKAFNPIIGADASVTEKDVAGAVMVYDGLGYDWVNWGRRLTRDGLYNAATRSPFRKPEGFPDREQVARLEEDYKNFPLLQRVMDRCSLLFDGGRIREPVILEGAFWMRLLADIFIREAGADGISRNRFERPDGKVWASVNVLPSTGPGYNYTEESWYAVTNMVRPPVFCVKISGTEYNPYFNLDGLTASHDPSELAACILHSLLANKGVNSCEADVSKPETAPQPSQDASPEAEPCEEPGEPTPPVQSDPNAVSVEAVPVASEAELLPPEAKKPEATPPPVEAAPIHEPIPEPIPTETGKTWGQIKLTQVWLKGLTSSKELQAPAPLSRVLETVVSHEATKRMTDECRAIADKGERNIYKRDNLHVWYPSVQFDGRAGGSTKENVAGYTGIACLDFDGMKSFEEAENTRDDIFMEFPEVLFTAVSASGLGVYALVMLDFDGSEAGYKAALSGAMESFEAKGYMPDTGCVDPTRARYMSSDADALSRPDGYVPKAFSASVEGGFILPASMLRTCWTNSGRKRKGAGKAYLDEALRRIETAPEGMKDTTITSVMGSVARLIRNYGLDSEKVYDKVRQVAFACGYDTKKTEDKIRRLGVKNEGGLL